MQSNTYVTIWNFVVFVLDETLDVYTEWETFIRHGIAREEHMSERREFFIETLVEKSLISLPGRHEVIPDVMDSYLGWFFMLTDPSSASVPSPDAMIRLKQSMLEYDFNQMGVGERELFATGYKSPLMVDAGFTIPIYFRWLSDHKAGSLHDKKIALVGSWLKNMEANAAAQKGFAIHNVFSDEPVDTWRRYSYTSRLSDKVGFDLLLVNAGTYSGQTLAEIAEKVIKAGSVVEGLDFVMPGITLPDGTPLRMTFSAIRPVDGIATTRMQASINHGMKGYIQVLVADKNNVLPGEAGYDQTFDQNLPEDSNDA